MNVLTDLSQGSYDIDEQIARLTFNALPEQDSVLIIMDKAGNIWPSNSSRFSELNLTNSSLCSVCERIDAGGEPVLTNLQDCPVLAAELVSHQTFCGYVILLMPRLGPEAALSNASMFELIINQFCVIATLIEKNNMLYELQFREVPYSRSPEGF